MNEQEQDIEQTGAATAEQTGDQAVDQAVDQVVDQVVEKTASSTEEVSTDIAAANDEAVVEVGVVAEGDVVDTHTPAMLEQAAAGDQELKHLFEATLLAAGRPVTTQQLLDLFEERDRPTPEQLQAALSLLEQDYASRGIELVQVASGWRIQVRTRYVESVSRLWQERPSKYSRALLETLALVAYRQPITRSEIEEIRGVSISSTIMRTLQERNWIRVVGHREVPGRPELLGTTREFLDYFGLKSLDQLPTLAELKDLETIGVQLELPGGKSPAATTEETQATAEDASAGDIEEDATPDASAEDPELSADAEAEADEEIDDDGDATPTLVASADDDGDESRFIVDPPRDDR